jgi:hypothetical protein
MMTFGNPVEPLLHMPRWCGDIASGSTGRAARAVLSI